MPLKTYDESINFLRSALDRAKGVRIPTHRDSDRVNLDFGKEKLQALRRLERFTRAIENRVNPQADFDAVMKHEHAISASLDGRTVFDDRPARNFFVGNPGQRSLFET